MSYLRTNMSHKIITNMMLRLYYSYCTYIGGTHTRINCIGESERERLWGTLGQCLVDEFICLSPHIVGVLPQNDVTSHR